MNDNPTLGLRRRDDIRKLHRRLWLWTAISLVALSTPAWAGERPHATVITVIAPSIAPPPNSLSVAALFGEHDAVAQSELAAQRGGAAFTFPIAQTSPSPQTVPQIILWDELKSAAPAAPAGQGTNRINIQIR